jgi:hypothetical protein
MDPVYLRDEYEVIDAEGYPEPYKTDSLDTARKVCGPQGRLYHRQITNWIRLDPTTGQPIRNEEEEAWLGHS